MKTESVRHRLTRIHMLARALSKALAECDESALMRTLDELSEQRDRLRQELKDSIPRH